MMMMMMMIATTVLLMGSANMRVAAQEEPLFRCEAVDLTSAALEVRDVTIAEIQSDIDESASAVDSENCFPTNFPDNVVVRTTGVVTGVGRTSPPMFYMQDGNGTAVHIPTPAPRTHPP